MFWEKKNTGNRFSTPPVFTCIILAKCVSKNFVYRSMIIRNQCFQTSVDDSLGRCTADAFKMYKAIDEIEIQLIQSFNKTTSQRSKRGGGYVSSSSYGGQYSGQQYDSTGNAATNGQYRFFPEVRHAFWGFKI